MLVGIGVWQKGVVLVGEFQVLFHKKVSNLRTKVVTIIEDIKSIFLLIEKDAFGKMSNFETTKMFEETKVFAFEMCGDDCFKGFNLGEVVTSNKNIININQDNSNGSRGG